MSLTFNAVIHKGQEAKVALLQAFSQVLDRGEYFYGPEVEKLEHFLRSYLGTSHVRTVASGHDALQLAVQAWDLPLETEIVAQANAYPTIFPLLLAGYQVKLVDVDENGQMDPQKLAAVMTAKTKIVVVTHLYGLCGDVSQIHRICQQHDCLLIEDCAQSFGTTFKDKMTGSFGQVGCFSFYPSKNLGALGDGGAIATSQTKIWPYFKAATQYGEVDRYDSQFIAGHSRLPELQAAGLNVYLTSLEKTKTQRQLVWEWYSTAFAERSMSDSISLFQSHTLSDPFYHLCAVKVRDRDKLRDYLAAADIPTLIHYPISAHQVQAFSDLGWSAQHFPVAENLAKTQLSLPFHEYLTQDEVLYIVNTIEQFYDKR